MSAKLTEWLMRLAPISGDSRRALVRMAWTWGWDMQDFEDYVVNAPSFPQPLIDTLTPFEMAAIQRLWRQDFIDNEWCLGTFDFLADDDLYDRPWFDDRPPAFWRDGRGAAIWDRPPQHRYDVGRGNSWRMPEAGRPGQSRFNTQHGPMYPEYNDGYVPAEPRSDMGRYVGRPTDVYDHQYLQRNVDHRPPFIMNYGARSPGWRARPRSAEPHRRPMYGRPTYY